jgi:hypothetical protein
LPHTLIALQNHPFEAELCGPKSLARRLLRLGPMKLRTALLFCSILLSVSVTAHSAPAPTSLDAKQRDWLRYKLENLFNEQDLMIRNQKVDRSDVEHQRREFTELKVFERIPFREDLPGLRKSIEASTVERGLKLISFNPLPKHKPTAPRLPESIYTDGPNFKLSNEQLVDEIPFQAVIQGPEAAVTDWIMSWPEDQLRLAEPEGKSIALATHKLPNGKWEVKAHAFRFRDIKFPTLRPRDPAELLPTWAAGNTQLFAQNEPLLWTFVTRTRAITPQALPLYRNREEMALNAARMSFFISKAAPRSETGPGRPPSHSH